MKQEKRISFASIMTIFLPRAWRGILNQGKSIAKAPSQNLTRIKTSLKKVTIQDYT